MPQWVVVDVDVTEPLLVWVTVVVLLFVADAAPVVTFDEDVPVFEPLFVFVAVESLPEDVAVWELSFDPETCDNAALYPEFALAFWSVDTDAHWSTLNDVPWPGPRQLPSSELRASAESEPDFEFVDVTFPLFDWATIAAAVFAADAAPLLTAALEVPVFIPVFMLLALPSLAVPV